MLGSPTERVGRALYYDLGPERASIGLSDDEYLRITFSGGGRVGQTTVLE